MRTNFSLQQFFGVPVALSCARRGIASPITPDLLEHLRSDNKGALLVQCPSDANKDWLYELVRKRQSELGRRGYAGAISALVKQAFRRRRRRRNLVVADMTAQYQLS